MRAYRSFLIASASLLAAITGCASSAAPREEIASNAESLSTTTDRVVTVRRDLRKCVAPLCGGYWVRELNRDGDERYVSSIDLSAAGLDDAAIDGALADAAHLVVRGRLGPADPRFGTRPLLATDAWRGLPGVDAAAYENVYAVAPRTPHIECFTAPCPNEIASLVNTRTSYAFDGVDVAPAQRPFVDADWLAARVVDHGALVSASWARGEHFPGGYAWLLRVHQVYVHLPDRVGPCPAAPVTACGAGTIAAYQRNADRCVIQTACVPSAICPMYLPVCAEGYTLASWTGESGCLSFACDPSFVVR